MQSRLLADYQPIPIFQLFLLIFILCIHINLLNLFIPVKNYSIRYIFSLFLKQFING